MAQQPSGGIWEQYARSYFEGQLHPFGCSGQVPRFVPHASAIGTEIKVFPRDVVFVTLNGPPADLNICSYQHFEGWHDRIIIAAKIYQVFKVGAWVTERAMIVARVPPTLCEGCVRTMCKMVDHLMASYLAEAQSRMLALFVTAKNPARRIHDGDIYIDPTNHEAILEEFIDKYKATGDYNVLPKTVWLPDHSSVSWVKLNGSDTVDDRNGKLGLTIHIKGWRHERSIEF